MTRRSVIQTARGTRTEAFGPVEWGLLAAVAIIWGSSFLLIDEALTTIEPGMITLSRLALGAAALAVVPAARAPVARADYGAVAVLAVFWMAIPFILFPIAQQWIESSLAGMLNASMPLFSAAVAAILLRRLPRHLQAIGLLVGFVGILVLFIPQLDAGGSTLLGATLVIVATACYGVAVNLAVPLQQRYGALPVLLRALLLAVVMVLPFGLADLPGSSLSASSAVSVLILGVVGSGLAFVAMATLVGRAGATRGAIAVYFIPIVAMALGLLRGETIEAIAYGGVALVIAGAYLTSRKEA